ncbi:hypothetical protein CXM81_10230 [Citrobacter freundii]|uniref:hypothetical protein n=1 Tax=Citrobacter sp. MGH105 TaxID=1686380 RepID=UPI00065105A5|nr:hypothetical protein [Citrobacter sp. MGH105]QNM20400.1 hypothetical protein CXM87_10230 [Citrobacter freundii]QNM25859.1 hypothetical protein CXM82_11500 [Citrobacter freundii]QNM30553.1 hypothetical protein CXM80_10230 [Citrobacter freundii]QNM35789.1 hypothetical protein CXM81_10230 [Citrobacter freundii]
MKKFITKLMAEIFSVGLVVLLAYSVWEGVTSLTAIAAAAYWIIIALAIFVGLISCIGIWAIEKELEVNADPEKREKLIGSLEATFKKQGFLRKSLNWINLTIVVCLLAYSGWVFTAVTYVLISLLCKLVISMGREKFDNLKQQVQG